ncbi:MAG: type I DNA topoisomerase [Erysipelotrichaceae bacterium]|nr:type I DNA topoisomerase [Erysipelotrichaceae bacterium]
MKKLVIVESPSKSKTIEKYLGADYEVVSSKGHIRDLAIKGKGGLGVEVENEFKPIYTISKDKEKLVKELKAKAAKSSAVLLATDPDREGEAISWHLAQVLGLDTDEDNRIIFNEITKKTILASVEKPRKIDMGLVKSQETRRILDRIIGFKLSNLLQTKIKSKSAGRVQSVALRMICDREKEIKSFIPEEYWTIKALFNKDKQEFETNLTKINNKKAVIKNADEAQKILRELNTEFIVSNVKAEEKKRFAKLPFITSSLQQEASSKFGYPAKKTMMIAQKLYEGIELKSETIGLITYMRTDSTRLSTDFVSAAKDLIKNQYGKEYIGYYKVKNDGQSQDAHEAIRPTDINNTPDKVKDYLTAEQYKIYSFIYNRALASLMAPCINDSITYTINNGIYDFSASGQTLKFDGFLKVYKEYDNSKDFILPNLVKDESLTATKIIDEQHFTEAPSRYTEAKLIKALEEEGVGRPSTYATIVDTIIKRGYVEYKKNSDSGKTKYFFPTEQGILTDDRLREFFIDIINTKYTANMEHELDEIAEDKLHYVNSLQKFWDDFMPLVENAYDKMEKIQPTKTGDICPECGGELVIRNGRYGKFISCGNFPKCRYTKQLEENKVKFVAEPIGELCPECQNELLKRKSRYGKFFIGCSNFPKCHYLRNIEVKKEKDES